MARAKLEVGVKVIRGSDLNMVLDIDANQNVILEEINTRNRTSVLRSALEKELLLGVSQFFEANESLSPTTPVPFDLLSAEYKAIARRRKAYVIELESQSANQSALSVIDEVRQTVAQKLNDQTPPSNSSLMRWLRAWKISSGDIMSLVPAFKARGCKDFKLDPRAVTLVKEVIKKHYWIMERPHLKSTMLKLEQAFDVENQKLDDDDQLEIPSYPTVHRIEKSMDAYERMAGREGNRAADRYFRPVLSKLEVGAPLDLVQIDHTVLDIHVLAPVSGWVARPRITVALDTYSRMPIGIYLGFVSAGYESVMLCLKQSIEGKESLLDGLTSVVGDWPCHGLPRKILVDNGMEFHSSHFIETCSGLGISVVNHPVCEPRYKGAVERFFRTLNQGFISNIKGRTFSNSLEKGDYDSVAKAALPFETFREILFKWVIDVYCRRHHRGIDAVPLDCWNEGVRKYPVDLLQRPEDLLPLIAKVSKRRLNAQGIELNTAHYNSEELNKLFIREGKPRDFTVKLDPLDVGRIFVHDPVAGRFIVVPSIDGDLDGVSEWQHKLARKFINERAEIAGQTYDIKSALIEIDAVVNNAPKRRKSNTRAARHLEYEQRTTEEARSEDLQNSKGVSLTTVSTEYSDLISEAQAQGWDSEGEEGIEA